ncbi:MAG: hypothetical protein M1815_004348 [Lichina confinis]|nr:MAG: hypothetical protein M1815_004348 [Lichina confinis]
MKDYSKLRVVDLKAELKKRGLPQSGLKDALIARLRDADAEAAEASPKALAGEPAVDETSHLPPSGVGHVSATEVQAEAALPASSDGVPSAVSAPEPAEKSQPGTAGATADSQLVEPASGPVEPVESIETDALHESAAAPAAPAVDAEEKVAPELEKAAAAASDPPSIAGLITSPLSSTEATADARKRKRRSGSPTPLAEDVAQKRARHGDEEEAQAKDVEDVESKDVGSKDVAGQADVDMQDHQTQNGHARVDTAPQLPLHQTEDITQLDGTAVLEKAEEAQPMDVEDLKPEDVSGEADVDMQDCQAQIDHAHVDDKPQPQDTTEQDEKAVPDKAEEAQPKDVEDVKAKDVADQADVEMQDRQSQNDHAHVDDEPQPQLHQTDDTVEQDGTAVLDKADDAGNQAPLPESPSAAAGLAEDPTSDRPAADQQALPREDIAAENGSHGAHPTAPADVVARRSPSPSKQPTTTTKDGRFKDLFPARRGNDRPSSPPADDGGRDVEPALHPATSALYIRELMRPLHPRALRDHLIALAAPPRSSPDSAVVTNFFLDQIRTHCLVAFASVSAASRVRSALHQAVWPEERSRKPLWADFVPEDKIGEWIDIETGVGGGGGGGGGPARLSGPKRWEVVYEPVGDDNDDNDDDVNVDSGARSGVVAVLREVGAHAPPSGSGAGVRGASLGPRTDRIRPTESSQHDLLHPQRQEQQQQQQQQQTRNEPARSGGSGFMALDALFRSTAAKPKLYFQPVARSLADRRLDLFGRLVSSVQSSRGEGGGGGGGGRGSRGGGGRGARGHAHDDELRQYTFEDGDLLVDCGPERDGSPLYRSGGPGGPGGGGPGGNYYASYRPGQGSSARIGGGGRIGGESYGSRGYAYSGSRGGSGGGGGGSSGADRRHQDHRRRPRSSPPPPPAVGQRRSYGHGYRRERW